MAEVPATAPAVHFNARDPERRIGPLSDRARKAVERKGSVASNRGKRLAQALMPDGIPAERLYPPLSWMLQSGPGVPDALRRAAGRSTEGAAIIDLGLGSDGGTHGG